jgi:hypothetical protein
VHKHEFRVKFSEKLLQGTWIEQHVQEAEDKFAMLYVQDDLSDDETPLQRQRNMHDTSISQQQDHYDAELDGSDGSVELITDTDALQQKASELEDPPLHRTSADSDLNGSDPHPSHPFLTTSGSPEGRNRSRGSKQGGRQRVDHTGASRVLQNSNVLRSCFEFSAFTEPGYSQLLKSSLQCHGHDHDHNPRFEFMLIACRCGEEISKTTS